MADWDVTDSRTGQILTLSSEDETPPTEQELEQIFATQEKLPGLRANAQTSPAQTFINTIFAPANFVREGVSKELSGQFQTIQDAAAATGLGQLLTAGTASPLREAAAQVPRDLGRLFGTVASIPLDPTTYAFGGALSIPNRIARMMASGAVGAASPALQSYGQTGTVDSMSTLLGGTLGGAFGAMAKVNPKAILTGEGSPIQLQPLPEIPITTAAKTRALQSIRQGFLSAPKIAGEEFEQGLNKLVDASPNQKVDLSGVVKQLQDAEQTTPGVRSTLNRAIRTNRHAAFVESLLSQDPSVASELTLQQAQALKRTLQDAMRNKWNQFAPELSDVHLELQDAWHGIRQAQLAAFPEMQDVLSAYGQQLNKFRVLKQFFRQGRLSEAIMGKLGNEPEIRTMAEQLLPDETLKRLKMYRRTQQVIGGAKVLTGGLAIEELLRKMLGR